MAQVFQIPLTHGQEQDLLARLDDSVQRRSRLWMYVLLAVGFGVRVWHASGTFLNPDEAMHFLAANQTSWWLAAKASFDLSHPPLLILVLYAWRSLGTSEILLRMPSILAGTAFCWLAYKWFAMLFRESVAWTAFVLCLFLPASIDLSTEVRQYALLLAFATACAYLLECALAKNSVVAMLFSGVCLWLAISSHYSAFLFAAALGIYTIARLLQQKPRLKIFAAWELGQGIALGLCYFFYVFHISKLGPSYGVASATRGWMGSSYLANSYFWPGKINPLLFIFARTGGVFQYLFGQSAVGDLAYPIFVIGIILLFRKPDIGRLPARLLGALMLLPFALNCAAALARVYPYGGTRHSAFLLPFALAGIGAALGHFLRQRTALGITVALVAALVCNLFPSHRLFSREDQKRANMQSALDFMRQQIPQGEPIFTDFQSSFVLRFYLCDQGPVAMDNSVPGFLSFRCGESQVITTDWNTAIFAARSFYDQWHSLIATYKLSPGTKVWVTQAGSPANLATELQKFPQFHLASHSFGNRIEIFDLTVGQSLPNPDVRPTS
jgi:dolichyl-phosphate-mannose-protein mannosyltransferase